MLIYWREIVLICGRTRRRGRGSTAPCWLRVWQQLVVNLWSLSWWSDRVSRSGSNVLCEEDSEAVIINRSINSNHSTPASSRALSHGLHQWWWRRRSWRRSMDFNQWSQTAPLRRESSQRFNVSCTQERVNAQISVSGVTTDPLSDLSTDPLSDPSNDNKCFPEAHLPVSTRGRRLKLKVTKASTQQQQSVTKHSSTPAPSTKPLSKSSLFNIHSAAADREKIQTWAHNKQSTHVNVSAGVPSAESEGETVCNSADWQTNWVKTPKNTMESGVTCLNLFSRCSIKER